MSKQQPREVYRVGQSPIVHLSLKCNQVSNGVLGSIRPMDRDTAEAWDLEICKYCTDDHPYQGE